MRAQIAIVASEFNEYISKVLLSECLKELKKSGVPDRSITTVWVPGSLEIPVAALKLAKKKNVDVVICLGAVIRGETYHFEVVANGVAQGIMHTSLVTGKPVIMGVVTTETIAQAQARAQTNGRDNKGREAAKTALAMVALLKKLK